MKPHATSCRHGLRKRAARVSACFFTARVEHLDRAVRASVLDALAHLEVSLG